MPRLITLSVIYEAEKKTREKGESLATAPFLYLGEIEARYYQKARKKSYSYESISSIARALEKAGLLIKRKDGKFVQYRLSKEGRKFMRALEELSGV